MVYMGSKNRIAKELIPIITQDLQPNQWYVEPFVGGCNMIDKIDHPYKLGADNNKYLIALFKAIQNGQELPEYITKDEYKEVKANKDNYPDWYVGFIGFVCSFRGKFFDGYVDNNILKSTGKYQHYQKQQINNVLKQSAKLNDVKLECCSYDALDIPVNSIIYCDPPYNDTTSYKTGAFDTDKFWQWCRDKVKEGYKVFVSEYNAPDDFECVWQKDISSILGTTSRTVTEKLFIYKQ